MLHALCSTLYDPPPRCRALCSVLTTTTLCQHSQDQGPRFKTTPILVRGRRGVGRSRGLLLWAASLGCPTVSSHSQYTTIPRLLRVGHFSPTNTSPSPTNTSKHLPLSHTLCNRVLCISRCIRKPVIDRFTSLQGWAVALPLPAELWTVLQSGPSTGTPRTTK